MKHGKVTAVMALLLAITIFMPGATQLKAAGATKTDQASSVTTTAKPVENDEEKLPYVGDMGTLEKLLKEMGVLYDAVQKDRIYPAVTAYPATEDVQMEVAVEEAAYDMAVSSKSEGSSVSGGGGGGGYSTTNVQVEGVDEGDIIKTDGQYIYYGYHSYEEDTWTYYGKIAVIKADGKNMELKSTIKLDGYLQEMYVIGNKLVTVQTIDRTLDPAVDGVPYRRAPSRQYTGYVVYDLSDKTKIKEDRRVEIEGYALSTRLVGTTLYFITNKRIYNVYYGNYSEYDILPVYRDTAVSNDETLVYPADIRYWPGKLQNNYMMMGAFDITEREPCVPQTILGAGNTIYMNTGSLYVARNNSRYYMADEDESENIYTTEIYRFRIAKKDIIFEASGTVDGHPLNQYSMDEYKGHLRIATTSYTKDWDEYNNLFVLDSKMKVVGEITNIAPGEIIYSVRFSGETGYVVTYEQTDPLFVIDLKNPTNPKIVGELKIPGFSQYLHYFGDGLLLGVGRNSIPTYVKNDDGTEDIVGATDRGVKVSLFDVSNPKSPKELSKLVIGKSWSTETPVSHDPHALMLDLNKSLVALPIYTYAYDSSASAWNGIYVLTVSRDGINTEAQLEFSEPDDDGYYYDANQRAVYIGDTFYTVDRSGITAYNYNTFNKLSELRHIFK